MFNQGSKDAIKILFWSLKVYMIKGPKLMLYSFAEIALLENGGYKWYFFQLIAWF